MTKEEIYLFLDKEAKFTFAKSMPNIPPDSLSKN